MFPFFKSHEENRLLKKTYVDSFIEKVKPLLNKRAEVAKPPKTVVLSRTSTPYLIPIQRQISKTK